MKTINLHNPVDNESFIGWGEREYITRLANEMREAGDEDVLLSINTPGGSVFDGYNLLAAMDDAKGNVIARVEGLAASMGAYFLAYADQAQARENSRIMIHKAYTRYMPEDEEARIEVQNELDIINNKMSKTFLDRGMNQDLVSEIFEPGNTKNYWFSANEALEVGLIDEVIPSGKQAQAIAASSEDLNKMVDKFAWWNTQNVNYSDIKSQNKGDGKMFLTAKDKEKFNADLQELQNTVNGFSELKAKIEQLIAQNPDSEGLEQILATINETSEKLEGLSANLDEKVTELNAKIDEVSAKADENTKKIEALEAGIKNTISDFEAPVIDESTSAKITTQPSAKKIRKEIANEINNYNNDQRK